MATEIMQLPPQRRDDCNSFLLFHPRKRTVPDLSSGPTFPCVVLSRPLLESLFHLPQTKAAKKLGLGLTTLKKACRRFRIKVWPYQQWPGRAKRFQDPEGRRVYHDDTFEARAPSTNILSWQSANDQTPCQAHESINEEGSVGETALFASPVTRTSSEQSGQESPWVCSSASSVSPTSLYPSRLDEPPTASSILCNEGDPFHSREPSDPQAWPNVAFDPQRESAACSTPSRWQQSFFNAGEQCSSGVSRQVRGRPTRDGGPHEAHHEAHHEVRPSSCDLGPCLTAVMDYLDKGRFEDLLLWDEDLIRSV
jgi:hypothetical protein